MKTQPVDPAIITVWRCYGAVLTVIPIAPIMIVSSVNELPFRHGLLALFVVVAASLSWLWPPAAYRRLSYSIDETGIVIRRGVFFQSHIALPRVRIQHTDVSQGPLQRRFGIATLAFYTAGSHYTKIDLPGLAHANALEIRDALLAEGQLSGV
jgi:membrane protein YdbS with pleckstrin-like domain